MITAAASPRCSETRQHVLATEVKLTKFLMSSNRSAADQTAITILEESLSNLREGRRGIGSGLCRKLPSNFSPR